MTEKLDRQTPREYILSSLKTVAMVWDDARDEDLTFGYIAEHSHEKRVIIASVRKFLDEVSSTLGFKKSVAEFFSDGYDVGVGIQTVYDELGVCLQDKEIGIFDEKDMAENEKKFLGGELVVQSARLLMAFGFESINVEDGDEEPNLQDLLAKVSRTYRKKDGKWRSPKSFKKFIADYSEKRVPDLEERLKDRYDELAGLIEWADEFKMRYNDKTFVKMIADLRPLLKYKEME